VILLRLSFYSGALPAKAGFVSAAVMFPLLLAFLSLLACPTVKAYVGPSIVRNISGYRVVFRDYNWKGEEGVILQVFRGNTKLLERRARSLFLFDIEKQEDSYSFKEADVIKCADLTGDGVIDLVVQEWTGGAYGCYKYDIYSLGKKFKRIWHHDAVYGHLRLDFSTKNKALLAIEDTTFCNFKSVAQGSGAKPRVYLAWRNGFKVDRAATIAAARASMKNNAEADNSNSGSSGNPGGTDPESTAGARLFVELIYGGEAAKALALLDGLESGPKRDYLSLFVGTFKTSPFYYGIISLNDRSRRAMAKIEKLAQEKAE
jgi:hypothetical protein